MVLYDLQPYFEIHGLILGEPVPVQTAGNIQLFSNDSVAADEDVDDNGMYEGLRPASYD
jgi:hypothetical protein